MTQIILWIFNKGQWIKISGTVDTGSEKMWSEFHKLHSSDKYSKKWREYLISVGCQPKPVFYQHVTTELFEQIKKKESSKKSCALRPFRMKSALQLMKKMSYGICMAGYVLHKLKKKGMAIDNLRLRVCDLN